MEVMEVLDAVVRKGGQHAQTSVPWPAFQFREGLDRSLGKRQRSESRLASNPDRLHAVTRE